MAGKERLIIAALELLNSDISVLIATQDIYAICCEERVGELVLNRNIRYPLGKRNRFKEDSRILFGLIEGGLRH